MPFIVWFALGSLPAIYLPPHAWLVPWLKFASVFILLPMCAVLYLLSGQKKACRSPWTSKRANRKLFLIAIYVVAGTAFGACIHGRASASCKMLCLGLPEPSSLEGRVATDPRKTASALWSFELRLENAFGKDGAKASASGSINVYSRKSCPVKGQKIAIDIPSGLQESRNAVDAWQNAMARPYVFIDKTSELENASAAELARSQARNKFLMLLKLAGSSDGGPNEGTGRRPVIGRLLVPRAGLAAGAILEALILGVKDDLDPELSGSFQKAGCSHILALSGQHVAVLAALLAFVLGRIAGPYRAKALACLLAAFYLWLVGPSPSVLRAVIMFWLSSLFAAMDRPQNSITILAWVFVIAGCLDPVSVYALSFKLSYMAVLGIALFNPLLDFYLRRWLPPFLSAAIATGFAALAATAPLSVISFGSLNPLSPLWSAMAGILVTALMWAGFGAAAGIYALSALGKAIGLIAGYSGMGFLSIFTDFSSFLISIPFLLLEALMKLAARIPSVQIPENKMGLRFILAVLLVLFFYLLYALPHVLARKQKRKAFFPDRSSSQL